MRIITGVLSLVLLVPAVSSGQSLVVHGAAGPTIIDSGHSVAGAVGFAPASRMTLLFDVERTHLSSRVRRDGRDTITAFRGGTVTLAAAEIQVALRGRHRLTPYALAGIGAGVSRPNVNEVFPERIAHNVSAMFLGGGIQVPLGGQVSAFADARMIFGTEAGELLALAPLRAGVAWRF